MQCPGVGARSTDLPTDHDENRNTENRRERTVSEIGAVNANAELGFTGQSG